MGISYYRGQSRRSVIRLDRYELLWSQTSFVCRSRSNVVCMFVGVSDFVLEPCVYMSINLGTVAISASFSDVEQLFIVGFHGLIPSKDIIKLIQE